MKTQLRKTSLLLVLSIVATSVAIGEDCNITDAPQTVCNMYCDNDASPMPPSCYENKLDGPCMNDQYQSGSDYVLTEDYYQIPYTHTYTLWNYDAATDTCSTTSYSTRTIASGTCTTYDADSDGCRG